MWQRDDHSRRLVSGFESTRARQPRDTWLNPNLFSERCFTLACSTSLTKRSKSNCGWSLNWMTFIFIQSSTSTPYSYFFHREISPKRTEASARQTIYTNRSIYSFLSCHSVYSSDDKIRRSPKWIFATGNCELFVSRDALLMALSIDERHQNAIKYFEYNFACVLLLEEGALAAGNRDIEWNGTTVQSVSVVNVIIMGRIAMESIKWPFRHRNRKVYAKWTPSEAPRPFHGHS